MTCVLKWLSVYVMCFGSYCFFFRIFTPVPYEPYVSPIALDSHLWMQDVGLVDISMTNSFCSYCHMLI
jgi:hypothetical protein